MPSLGSIESYVLIKTKITGGLPGKTGKSAYQVWLEQPGNEGKTEEEFFDSLSENIMPDFLQEMRQVGETDLTYSDGRVTTIDGPTSTVTINYENQSVASIEEFFKIDSTTIKTTVQRDQGRVVKITKEVI